MKKFDILNQNYENKVRDSFARQGFMGYVGAEIVNIDPGYCEIQVPFRSELSQQHGYFHAGIIGTIADNAGGYAAFTLMEEASSILTVEYKINFVAPGDGNLLIGRGKVIKPGKTLTTCRCDLFVFKHGAEKLCATSQMTLMKI